VLMRSNNLSSKPLAASNSAVHTGRVAAALQAGLVPLLTSCLQPTLTPHTSAGALKSSWLVANLAADAPDATPELLALAPLLIVHLGTSYGPAISMQCAWALGNLAASSPSASATLQAQGAIPSLLSLIDTSTRSPNDSTLATAGVAAASALSNIIRTTEGPRAANALLSLKSPSLVSVLTRALGDSVSASAPELLVESAWLLANAASASTAAQQLCGGKISVALASALELAAAALGEGIAAQLRDGRSKWIAVEEERGEGGEENDDDEDERMDIEGQGRSGDAAEIGIRVDQNGSAGDKENDRLNGSMRSRSRGGGSTSKSHIPASVGASDVAMGSDDEGVVGAGGGSPLAGVRPSSSIQLRYKYNMKPDAAPVT
jgi:hypothetical protein